MDVVASGFRRGGGEVVAPRAATRAQLERVHEAAYVSRIDRFARLVYNSDGTQPGDFAARGGGRIIPFASDDALTGERPLRGGRPRDLRSDVLRRIPRQPDELPDELGSVPVALPPTG